ncbi:PIG-L family deacetylase [Methylobacillus arboreus]|uniref:PIG-L deacetylase family protein n=1 Tax=Methylobacillus arboreus TaxID=755170 RepID=UPI001E5B9F00|nr:PIG-L family deacetylase [Methylobacillus arboreus]MCB5191836.1 PIG-L family deacetylase [Methylobacillus arboreus]
MIEINRGTSARSWRDWTNRHNIPSVTLAGVVPPGKRLVIVSPHPDDEILCAGGLLALATASQRECLLIAVTNGEASHPDSLAWSPSCLAAIRARETEIALSILHSGRIQIVRANLPDGCLNAAEPCIQSVLEKWLTPNDVVVCPWQNDGHPDHEAVARACFHVANDLDASLLQAPIWGWHACSPDEKLIDQSAALKLNFPREIWHRKKTAIHAFRSQLEPDPSTGAGPILPTHVLEHFYNPYEIFLRGCQ